METLTLANGLRTQCTGSALTSGKTAESTRGIGPRISCTAKGFTRGLMGASTTETTKMIRKMELEHSTGQMAANIKVAGATENNMGKPFLRRLIKSLAKASGKMENGQAGPPIIARVETFRHLRKINETI